MEAVNGVSEGEKGGPPPPSPLTGCYLLIVIGEPHSQEHKDIILQRVAKGLLSWDVNNCLVDLEKELAIITEQAPEGEEARYGERLIQFASENLVTEVLIHPVVSTLAQCVRNLLSSFTRHRHIVHAGYTFASNGSWILQDGTFSVLDFSEAFQEIEVQRVIRAYENSIGIDIHCSPEGEWNRLPKESFTKGCKIRINPNDVLTSGTTSITNFITYISPFLIPTEIENLLESSDVVGNIRFSHPTLYIFPGGQGDAALFGINGFNMLLDGGFSRKACFWDFVRHLDRLDAVLFTRLNNSNVMGISSVLRRKKQNAVYPQIGHFFCNIQEKKAILSPDGDKDRDPLLINILEEGQEIVSNLSHLNLTPQPCYRDAEPINLYHKVGHGTLDMYVLNPIQDSKEVKDFLQKWNTNDPKVFSNQKFSKDVNFPLPNLVSICALLVWQPANPTDLITRILFPGSCPQYKIFEGLDKIKHLEFVKHPTCSESSLTPTASIIALKSKQNLEKLISSEQKTYKRISDKQRPIKDDLKSKIIENNKRDNDVRDNQSDQNEKNIKKSDSTESDKNIKTSKPKKIENDSSLIVNGKAVDSTNESIRSKPEPKISKPKNEMQKRPKPIEKKPSPTTPKNAIDVKPFQSRTVGKSSPSSTPAKSTKEANNRKVVESKYKQVPKKEVKPEKKDVKVERKPVANRPKGSPLGKAPSSPIKRLVNGIQKPDSLPRKGKLDKEGTTDSSTVSTPSVDQESILKKDISKLTPEELENLKAQELAELKEEQEIVKEIEAVFQKGEKQRDKHSDLRKINDISTEDKEPEEYLIIEKEEIVVEDKSIKEDEIQKHTRDSEESEKQKIKQDVPDSKPDEENAEKVEDTKASATETEVSKEDISKLPKLETLEKQPLETPKEGSFGSQEDKLESSFEKKSNERDVDDDNKEIAAPESHPEEKVSATIESGATTAPTLPEDERITLDDIKEDQDQIIEEKHVKEETKEKDVPVIQLPPKTFETINKLPPVVGIRLDKQSNIRDLVKTPDEVADLPVHEEVDIDNYVDYQYKTDQVVEDIGSKKNEELVIEEKREIPKVEEEEQIDKLKGEKIEIEKVTETKEEAIIPKDVKSVKPEEHEVMTDKEAKDVTAWLKDSSETQPKKEESLEGIKVEGTKGITEEQPVDEKKIIESIVLDEGKPPKGGKSDIKEVKEDTLESKSVAKVDIIVGQVEEAITKAITKEKAVDDSIVLDEGKPPKGRESDIKEVKEDTLQSKSVAKVDIIVGQVEEAITKENAVADELIKEAKEVEHIDKAISEKALESTKIHDSGIFVNELIEDSLKETENSDKISKAEKEIRASTVQEIKTENGEMKELLGEEIDIMEKRTSVEKESVTETVKTETDDQVLKDLAVQQSKLEEKQLAHGGEKITVVEKEISQELVEGEIKETETKAQELKDDKIRDIKEETEQFKQHVVPVIDKTTHETKEIKKHMDGVLQETVAEVEKVEGLDGELAKHTKEDEKLQEHTEQVVQETEPKIGDLKGYVEEKLEETAKGIDLIEEHIQEAMKESKQEAKEMKHEVEELVKESKKDSENVEKHVDQSIAEIKLEAQKIGKPKDDIIKHEGDVLKVQVEEIVKEITQKADEIETLIDEKVTKTEHELESVQQHTEELMKKEVEVAKETEHLIGEAIKERVEEAEKVENEFDKLMQEVKEDADTAEEHLDGAVKEAAEYSECVEKHTQEAVKEAETELKKDKKLVHEVIKDSKEGSENIISIVAKDVLQVTDPTKIKEMQKDETEEKVKELETIEGKSIGKSDDLKLIEVIKDLQKEDDEAKVKYDDEKEGKEDSIAKIEDVKSSSEGLQENISHQQPGKEEVKEEDRVDVKENSTKIEEVKQPLDIHVKEKLSGRRESVVKFDDKPEIIEDLRVKQEKAQQDEADKKTSVDEGKPLDLQSELQEVMDKEEAKEHVKEHEKEESKIIESSKIEEPKSISKLKDVEVKEFIGETDVKEEVSDIQKDAVVKPEEVEKQDQDDKIVQVQENLKLDEPLAIEVLETRISSEKEIQSQEDKPQVQATELDRTSPLLTEFIDKSELGSKSPKEREQDVAIIVASVAEVLKSDAPLEEFEGKLPVTTFGSFTPYTTELRETHITTVESPVTDESRIPRTVDSAFLEEERKACVVLAESKSEESKRSTLIRDSQELMQATSKIISDIRGPKADEKAVTDDSESHIVHRMLVTASSEDGGEETVICPPGSIKFAKSSESSGRSSPDADKISSKKSSVTDVQLDKSEISIESSRNSSSDITTDKQLPTVDVEKEQEYSSVSTSEKVPSEKSSVGEVQLDISAVSKDSSGRSSPDTQLEKIPQIKSSEVDDKLKLPHEIILERSSTPEKPESSVSASPEILPQKEAPVGEIISEKSPERKDSLDVQGDKTVLSTDTSDRFSPVTDPEKESAITKVDSGRSSSVVKPETVSKKSSVTEVGIKDTPEPIKESTAAIKSEQEVKQKYKVSDVSTEVESKKEESSIPDTNINLDKPSISKESSGKSSPEVQSKTSSITDTSIDKTEIFRDLPVLNDKSSGRSSPETQISSKKSSVEEVHLDKSELANELSGCSSPDVPISPKKSSAADIELDKNEIVTRSSDRSSPDVQISSKKSITDIEVDKNEIVKETSGRSSPELEILPKQSSVVDITMHEKESSRRSSPDVPISSKKSSVADIELDGNEIAKWSSGSISPHTQVFPKIEIAAGKQDTNDEIEKSKKLSIAGTESDVPDVPKKSSGRSSPEDPSKKSSVADVALVKSEAANSGRQSPDVQVSSKKSSVIEIDLNKTDISKQSSGMLPPEVAPQSKKSVTENQLDKKDASSDRSSPDLQIGITPSKEASASDIHTQANEKAEVLPQQTAVSSVKSDSKSVSNKQEKEYTDGKEPKENKLEAISTEEKVAVTSSESGIEEKSATSTLVTPEVQSEKITKQHDVKSAEAKEVSQKSLDAEEEKIESPVQKKKEPSKDKDATVDSKETEDASTLPPEILSTVTGAEDLKVKSDMSESSTIHETKQEIIQKSLAGDSASKIAETVSEKHEIIKDGDLKEMKLDVSIAVTETTDESELKETITAVDTSSAKEESDAAGPSKVTRTDSSSSHLSSTKISSEDLHLSGKSTPDIADVEKIKEMQEILKHEKHIPGSSTPPTVPVSPIVKEKASESESPLFVKDVAKSTIELSSTEIKKSVEPAALTAMKEWELRSSTPGSDEYEHSELSSGQMSRAPNLFEGSERIDSDDDDLPGSPASMTSQVIHSHSSSHYDLEDDSIKLPTKIDVMSTSMYGSLTSETADENVDIDFKKAIKDHRQARGEDLERSCSPSYLHEITKAKYTSLNTLEPENAASGTASIVKQETDLMTSSFIGTELPSEPEIKESKEDPIASWGKPLGLPSPAPPNDNKSTPKKERKIPPHVSAKNKLNDDRKRSESPSKYDKKQKRVHPVYVDLTYVPHHGNSNYSFVDFFKRVRARYYVFSGIEPSREVYNALLEAKQTWENKDLEVTIIPTYDTDILGYWVAENEDLLTKYKIDLSPSASRCTINLQDHETSCSAYRLEF